MIRKNHFALVGLACSLSWQSSASAQTHELKKASIEGRDKVVLHYVEQGDGEPVVFVHGLTADYSVWLPQVEEFAKAKYRAITYSRRYNFPNENDVLPDHCASVSATDLAKLIKKLGLEKAHVIGHSYGAYAALILAIENPQLVRTLTLCEPPLAPWLSSLPADKVREAKEHSNRLLREGIFPARAAFAKGKNDRAIRLMIDAIAGKGTFGTLSKSAIERIRRNSKEMKAVVTSKNAYPFIPRDKVRQLAVPTLLLSGSQSVATAKFTDPELDRLLPKLTHKRIVIKPATHIMWQQQPTACRKAVLKFIGDHSEKAFPEANRTDLKQ